LEIIILMKKIFRKLVMLFAPRIRVAEKEMYQCQQLEVFASDVFRISDGSDIFGINHCFAEYETVIPPFYVTSIYKGICNTAREEVLVKNRFVIEQYTSQKKNPLIGARAVSRRDITNVKGKVAHLSLSGLENNYYHWCIECLGRLHLIRQAGIMPDYYIVSTKMLFQKQLLALLQIKDENIIRAQEGIWLQADELIVPTFINNWEYCDYRGFVGYSKKYLPSWIGQLYKDLGKPKWGVAKIFISRKKAKYRKLLNEEAVLQMLSKYDVVSICLEDLSVDEQINVFSSAAIVIGVHGAGLTNIIHCSKTARVLEIFPEYYHDPGYRILANALGLEYSFIIGNTENISVHPQQEDLVVSISLLEDAVKLICFKL
jgi:hypothetical protein